MAAGGQRLYEAEAHRLKGTLLLRQALADISQVEACFRRALDIAQHQQAKSLELRTAVSLSRLWLQQNKHGQARKLLVDICDRFTEGFDTIDFQEAMGLLVALK